MSFKPTPEQEAIVEAVRTTSDSLLISALAGAAKTSTLVLSASALPLVPTASIAFNKKIAEEMSRRLPSHVFSKTLNSIGFQTWMKTTGKKFKVEGDKMFSLLKEEADAYSGDDRRSINEAFASILRAARRAKSLGYVPDQYAKLGKPLASVEDWLDSVGDELDVELDDFLLGVTDKILAKSIALGYTGLIDFDDQIYMPTIFNGAFPRFSVLMVDETQDLSPLNHEMVERMVGERLIAVGDPNQAIYGFRGAHHSSMSLMKDRFNMREMTLSVSFRCPKAVIRKAQSRVPHMTWPEWAEEGKVESLPEWSAADIPDGAAIICRNNAPLFSCALALIRRGRSVKLMGADIGPALVKLLRKMGDGNLKRQDLYLAIDKWERLELQKARETRRAGISDRADCLRVFAEYGETLAQAVAWAENLFSSNGQILLMSGHKSKGLEFDIVFHLDPWRIPSKYAKRAAEDGDDSKLQQELNLRYVIETRAKREMYLINLEDMH